MALSQKFQTWKFATEFMVRKTLTRDQAKLGAWTKDRVVKLGPTFIKLGQIVSTRSDVYPREFVRELESLQDDVPPVPLVDTVDISVFQTFDEVPYKSASIGQVHRATLSTGEDVIVKVKRPHIYETMKFDTDTLMDIVAFLERLGFDTGTGATNVLQESVDYLLSETDYQLEIKNATMFREAMVNVPWITVPKVYHEYCTDDMIVMEYVPSEKLTELTDPRINKKTVCKALINSYIIQTMEKGFFHADPHPGNLGFTSKGTIVFYDFGLVIPISDNLMEGFKRLFACIIQRDTAGIVDILIELGIILPTTKDRDDIRLFFKTVLNYLETLDGSSVANDIMEDEVLLRLAQKKPFLVPTSFVYLAKTFSTIEGICVELDPDFTYYEYLEPLIQEQVSDIVDINKIVSATAEMPSRIKDISTAVLGLEKSRSSMTRKIEKARKEIQRSQLVLLFAMVALEQGHVTEYLGLLAVYSALRNYFS
jgi:predicted unusual protein kinase regulating ubiquinone biosynthesis (AarF/ABC1/UbiB family)